MRALTIVAALALWLLAGATAQAALCGNGVACSAPSVALTPASGTTPVTLYAVSAGSNGAAVNKILCASPASLLASNTLFFSVLQNGVSYALFSATISNAAGVPTAGSSTQDAMSVTTNGVPSFASLSLDDNGNPTILLQAGDVLQARVSSQMASGELDCKVQGRQF